MIHIIAAIAENNVLGVDNQIPWHIPEDLAHFKTLTVGQSVIMGRRTFESIGKPLPDRENIIVSSTLGKTDGAIVVSSLKEALAAATKEEIFIIGGAKLYEEAIPLADVLDITHVHLSPNGDTFFPTIDWEQYESVWHKEGKAFVDGIPNCTFITYRKK